MSTVIDIFDRKPIVAIIQANCLTAEKGAGTVVLSPQKSGKSHLLEYIYRQRDLDPSTLYCWINVDALNIETRSSGKLSDAVFLRYFLKVLHDDLCEYLARVRDREVAARAEVDRDEARLTSGEVEENDLRTRRETHVKSLKLYLKDLDTLRKYKDQIPGLLAAPRTENADDLYDFLISFIPKLKNMKKRIVIFIDDVHKIVGNHEFTEALLSLFRAGSSDGQLVPLLATPLHLMDPLLHRRNRGDQTRSLFNDVKVEVLNSFTEEEARSFLSWPNPSEPPLTEDEQEYVLELAGGSPHFLKELRDRFLLARPATDAARKAFELDVSMILATALETIWSRCTHQQRDNVRTAQTGKSHAPGMDFGPAACFVRPQGSSFSRLFESFLSTRKAAAPLFVDAHAVPAFRIFPTALCHAVPELLTPLVTITVTNQTRRDARVQLECVLEQFSLSAFKTVDVAVGETELVHLQVVLSLNAAANLTNPQPTQIRWTATADSGSGPHSVGGEGIHIKTLAIDQFLFASRDEAQNKLLNYSWLIAAWVNGQDEDVATLVRNAAETLNKQGAMMSGYPPPGPAAALAVSAQVQALYNALKEYGITYQSRTGAPFTDRKAYSQRVRRPHQSLREHSANCLDGAALFASLLAAADLNPVILFMPDHSLVGWWTAPWPAGELNFLEITDLMEKDFADSCREGKRRYEQVKNLINEESKTEISDIGNFAILVDIRGAWAEHEMGILPRNL